MVFFPSSKKTPRARRGHHLFAYALDVRGFLPERAPLDDAADGVRQNLGEDAGQWRPEPARGVRRARARDERSRRARTRAKRVFRTVVFRPTDSDGGSHRTPWVTKRHPAYLAYRAYRAICRCVVIHVGAASVDTSPSVCLTLDDCTDESPVRVARDACLEPELPEICPRRGRRRALGFGATDLATAIRIAAKLRRHPGPHRAALAPLRDVVDDGPGNRHPARRAGRVRRRLVPRVARERLRARERPHAERSRGGTPRGAAKRHRDGLGRAEGDRARGAGGAKPREARDAVVVRSSIVARRKKGLRSATCARQRSIRSKHTRHGLFSRRN